ncbi:MAG TPA: erythromycin esterase family protein [Longimicrobium sp.]|jgi:erythromycin esterase|uniref:erythromycin esterase family protein n=1 Tax=Longimicrobium sp. TaxID=2029185 RepID=UPI002ED9EC14
MLSSLVRRSLYILVALPLLGCDSPTSKQPPAELDVTWLAQNAVPFSTTDPGGDYAELAPLGAMIGDARIVGLGEATHGTHEFFRMKHRILEYLVREKGFSTFAIEATWAEANRLNRYVHTGEGDPEVLLSNLYFWTWNTREVLAMIQWMRAHNQNPGNAPKVSFYGFDMQHSRVAMDDAVAYLRRVDAAAADSAVGHYQCYRAFQDLPQRSLPPYGGAVSAEVQARCHNGVVAVHALLARRADEFAAKSDRRAFDEALRAARVVVQNEDMRAGPDDQRVRLRDTYMAENVAWLGDVAAPGSRMVLWAHNAHVSRRAPYMGTHLTTRYGNDYRVVGFSFYRGEMSAVVQGVGLSTASAVAAVDSSYEHQFHRLGLQRFIVDLRPLRSGAPQGAGWLLGPRLFRQVGALYNPATPEDFYLQSPLATEYDIMIHEDVTNASNRLPFRYE